MNKISKAFLLTVAGALLVAALKQEQAILAAALLSVLLAHLVRIWLRKSLGRTLEEAYYLVTFGTIGFLTESWGTQNGHWTYHHLPPGQSVPMWVPVAWAIAAVLLDKTDEHLRKFLTGMRRPIHPLLRIGMMYLMGILLPLSGESICIALGVWEYHWPFKVLGVPVLALLLISYAHLVFSMIRSGGRQLFAGMEHRSE
jgi:energy-coupling factor transporter transmembrane protein EcfT